MAVKTKVELLAQMNKGNMTRPLDRENIGDLVDTLFDQGGAGINPTNVTFVATKEDLPAPSSGIITLEPDRTYYFTDHVDLTGDRMVGAANTTILGASSENCSVTSTGLSLTEPLFLTDYTTPIRHITFKGEGVGIEVNPSNTGVQPIALDWTGVNFQDFDISCLFGDIDNFIYSKGAILSAGEFVFAGSVGTIGICSLWLYGSNRRRCKCYYSS